MKECPSCLTVNQDENARCEACGRILRTVSQEQVVQETLREHTVETSVTPVSKPSRSLPDEVLQEALREQTVETGATPVSRESVRGLPVMRAALVALGVVFIVGLMAGGVMTFRGRPTKLPEYQLLGKQGPTSAPRKLGERVFSFIVMPPNTAKNEKLFRAVARHECGSRRMCTAMFWLDEGRAARGLPLTDSQIDSLHAIHDIDRNYERDEFTCHAFDRRGRRCEGSDLPSS
jgi:hypothetical protein